DVLDMPRRLLRALAVDRHRPVLGVELARVLGRCVLVDAEFVIVVVGGDLLPAVQLLVGAEGAFLDVLELPPVRCGRRRRQADAAQCAAYRREGGAGRCLLDELAAVYIQLLVGNFRAGDLPAALDQHRGSLWTPEVAGRLPATP